MTFTLVHWVGFSVCIAFFLALDLGVFHKNPGKPAFKESILWTALWVVLAIGFTGMLFYLGGRPLATQFFTGYFIELSLSMDNVFVIALIFLHFKVPQEYQHRVLFLGILGALLMRGMLIGVGVALINRFDWILYVFGGFIVLTGIKMAFGGDEESHMEKNWMVIAVRKIFPVSDEFHGQKFFIRQAGRRVLTPLFVVLLLVEMTDLLFALDSVPAIFGVTRNSFLVFTSNVFAILGLRSLYFVLAGALGLFRYLKFGLSLVLIFIGVKMVIDPHDNPPRWFQYDIPDNVALGVVVATIAIFISASIVSARHEKGLKSHSGTS